jgi:hypothetical protein
LCNWSFDPEEIQLEKVSIPADNPKVQMMRSLTVRWGVVFGLLHRASARSPEEAKANLKKRYAKVANRILDPAMDREDLIEELAGKDVKFLPVGSVIDDASKLRIREKMRVEIEAEEKKRSAEPVAEVVETPPLGPEPETLVELVGPREIFSVTVIMHPNDDTPSLPQEAVSSDVSFDEEFFDSLESGLVDWLNCDPVDPSESALMDFLATPLCEPLSDGELWGIAAVLALQRIEHLKSSLGGPMVSLKLMEKLKEFDPRVSKQDAEHLVALLRDVAGSRFSEEEEDDDIPF